MLESVTFLQDLIKIEAEKLDYNRIFLAGQSMGGKMATSTLLTYSLPSPLAGIISISGSIALNLNRI
jgi:predicted esterase